MISMPHGCICVMQILVKKIEIRLKLNFEWTNKHILLNENKTVEKVNEFHFLVAIYFESVDTKKCDVAMELNGCIISLYSYYHILLFFIIRLIARFEWYA